MSDWFVIVCEIAESVIPIDLDDIVYDVVAIPVKFRAEYVRSPYVPSPEPSTNNLACVWTWNPPELFLVNPVVKICFSFGEISIP